MFRCCCGGSPSKNSEQKETRKESSTKNIEEKCELINSTQYMTHSDKNPFFHYENLPDNNSIPNTPIQSKEINELKKQNKDLTFLYLIEIIYLN